MWLAFYWTALCRRALELLGFSLGCLNFFSCTFSGFDLFLIFDLKDLRSAFWGSLCDSYFFALPAHHLCAEQPPPEVSVQKTQVGNVDRL
jgi:hypothetical protein